MRISGVCYTVEPTYHHGFENASATKHAMRPGQLLSTFAEKTEDEISAICSSYLSAVGEASVLPLACLAAMGLCLLVVSAHRHALYRPGLWALCAAVLVSAVYLGGLLMMYLFSMPTGEALILASLNRYLSTLDLWLVLMTAAVALASLGACPPRGRQRFYMEPPRDCALWLCCFSAGFRTRPCCITVSCTLSRTVPKSTQLLPKKAFLPASAISW